mmetsp:Transcript_17659/g.41207  ORF Transcript_17659/g.41207 Transcript_17659/m.41207 type:complete len:102 (-) Transcript_17659:154-459(-)
MTTEVSLINFASMSNYQIHRLLFKLLFKHSSNRNQLDLKSSNKQRLCQPTQCILAPCRLLDKLKQSQQFKTQYARPLKVLIMGEIPAAETVHGIHSVTRNR